MKHTHQRVKQLKASLTRAEKAITRKARHMKDKFSDIGHDTVSYVKNHPIKTITVSLITGAVLQRILRKRRK